MPLTKDQATNFCEWEDDPNHITLLSKLSYKVFAGHLPANGITLPHAHRHPTVCISLLSARQVKNYIHSSKEAGDQWLDGSNWPRGAVFAQLPDPVEPYVHTVETGPDPVLFVCAETTAVVRRAGKSAPPLDETAAPGASALAVLTESSFSSGSSLTLQPGAAVELRSLQTDQDLILLRLICWVGGPDLRCIHIRLPDGLTVQFLEDKEFDPLVQVAVIDGFVKRKGSEAICALHNLGEEVAEVAVVDVFETQ